jgi:hypothetical protein
MHVWACMCVHACPERVHVQVPAHRLVPHVRQVCPDAAGAGSVVRRYLQDHDTVVLRGHCQGQGFRLGFGECRGQLLPSS